MGKTGKLIVISGPSGVGKTTIAREAVRRTGVRFSTSVTTRRPRADEVDRRDYHFVDRPSFQKMIDAGELLEWAEVFGEFYGTPSRPVRDATAAGENVLLDIDVQGALQVHQSMPDAVFVMVVPPDETELLRRLQQRRSETDEARTQRFAKAKEEIAAADKSGVYNHRVVNDDLTKAINQVVEIINRESSQT